MRKSGVSIFLMDLLSRLLVEFLKQFSMMELPSGLLVEFLKGFSMMNLPSGLLVEFLNRFSMEKKAVRQFFDGFTQGGR